MAFNWQTFRTRSLSALVFVAIMAIGLFGNNWSFFCLFTVVHFGCWQEYIRLVGKIDQDYAAISPIHQYGVMIAGWCMMLYFSCDDMSFGNFKLHAMGFWLGLIALFTLPLTEILFAKQFHLKNIKYSLLGLIYISLSWGLLMDIRCMNNAMSGGGNHSFSTGFLLPLTIIFSIWINDTMAYIVGSLIGKTPFSSISPKKTWEGTIGGAILAIGAMALLANLWGFPWQQAAIIATIAAVMGSLGDLLESKLKRMASVKDSGNILPGHGGFLDRFDSLLLAVPFVWLYLKIVS